MSRIIFIVQSGATAIRSDFKLCNICGLELCVRNAVLDRELERDIREQEPQ